MKFYNVVRIILVFLLCVHCKDHSSKNLPNKNIETIIPLKYAQGFSIIDFNTYKVLEIKNPWPKSNKAYQYALVTHDSIKKELSGTSFEAIITIPIKSIVVTSTTHIPSLELLEEEQTLVGFPGIDYISSKKTRQRIDDQLVRELGKNEGINTEVLLELSPEVLIGFGIDGNNRTFETIKKSSIPVIYNGDWVENSPLAKAEWIKFFGVLFNKEKQADSIFNTIEKDYLEAKLLARNVIEQPTILSGAMHNDIWYLPNGNSTEAQLLQDANTHYLFKNSKGTGSLSLNFETVFEKAKNADIWLSPSNFSSLEALEKNNAHYTLFKAFQNKNVYSFNNTKGATGGVLYYELGMARPDLVLKDLIKICHPELLKHYVPYFFKKLD
ncbi:MAG: ABC transporter substrate-binding protein [Flavobacteriales bacterium]|nr:ABC transporter substrate-binding protein [Flavobacteriia bacterium]NCP06434.1 ABC transporter substrate-binding protein [Flavobacteriales bacterium]PIV92502.1 MAG: ABC transporter substrate-binding protein [Flavobacteriaceae bacterium CG17_big_fil_post_rev_8_21_14_2_50_33_15]PIY13417.1 MAG: ABC transporter substrate-binding protein [Flavobacteriaceae bacterium CG_4_10_14_3_um_filter_33_47]PJB19741.1 MAG: ABC transporter substrate-binding protein [Flavobacteriaceae bacterium CG_4_9_14_3_um_f